jgi:drug/metabolite transporter (DMT)-like permease
VSLRTGLLTAIAMTAFAANSLLCRFALRQTGLDPATFTLVRIASGALMLVLLTRLAGGRRVTGNWPSAAALLAYAACFSFAYVALSAGTGALLLFGAVQATMILRGLIGGERLNLPQWAGLLLALGGLVLLVLPGVSAPPLFRALLMAAAGVAWGVYSLRGRGVADPLAATAGNFARAVPLALLVLLAGGLRPHGIGLLYAVLSGAGASGLGYAIWYAALRGLNATRAATVQLSVPVITALASVPVLGERITLRLAIASVAVLGGIALVVLERRVAVRPAEDAVMD